MTEIYKLEQTHKAHGGVDRPLLQQLTINRDELKDLMENETNRIMNRHLRDKHRWGNKVGKHLAKILRKKRDVNFIDRIQNKKGEMRFLREIGEEFRQYFTSLYSVRSSDSSGRKKEERVGNFLKEAGLPRLTESDIKELDSPITEEEIRLALKSSPLGKSPGPDGFTSCFFKRFEDTLVPRLCRLWNGLGSQGELCEGALMASVTS